MKTVRFQPINETLSVKTETDLLQALLAKNLNVLMACGGKGLCATCHVHVRGGMEKVTPRTERENRTLSFITGASPDSRLACQCRVLGEGVVVELPEGMYIEQAEDLMSMLGKRAEINILHPINGSTLIAKGKIITRSRLEELKSLKGEVDAIRGG
ncbi:MAG: 2Fe-2S iron-sulfur cluster-binding protein [Planctomycetia bacterium]